MNQHRFKNCLLAGTVICSAAVAAVPAYAQDQVQTAPVTTVSAADVADAEGESIIITGSLFRRTNTETPSPVTVLSSESLALRGITNVADAVRSIAADNSGSVPTAFVLGFGAGAAGVSLRGLSVNSTITIVDGLRMVTYPLADDGQRAFVDLNTIPRVAIDRIEVLKDGASSTYGADAIGGVVNVLMRQHFEGVQGTIEGGIAQRGDGEQLRASILAGFGDYDANGSNIYFGAEYERNKTIWNRDRAFPLNTADLTSIGGAFGNYNTALNLGQSTAAVVRPAIQTDPTNILTGVAQPGPFQLLSASDCTSDGGTVYSGPEGTACQENQFSLYGRIQPETTRWGATVRASIRVGDNADAYLMGSFYRSNIFTSGPPGRVRSNNPVRTQGFVLPVRLSNGQLNPQNPYASQGLSALLYYRFAEFPATAERTSDVIRGATGISGTFGDGWTYSLEASAVSSKLEQIFGGVIHLPSLIQAVNQGTYNFSNPSLTSPSVLASVGRTVAGSATSNLYLAQGVVTRELAQLPGGPLQFGVGAQIRREELDQPNINPGKEFIDINQYFARGKRTVSAGFFEINAPIVSQLELQASGRYDNYSTGFSAFSPKIGFKFTPIREIAIRGTYSKGFRAPSFAESGDAGVVGFIGQTIPCNVKLQHGATGTPSACVGGNAYVAPQALGINAAANPAIKPEKSQSFTVGTIVQPLRWLSFTVDYYNINKTDIITPGPLFGQAVNAYYAGQPLPAGYTVQTNPVDPQFPAGLPTVAIVNAFYQNASSFKTSGIDFSATAKIKLSENANFTSEIDVTDIIQADFIAAAGEGTQHWVGTQAPYILSSGAGTPKWRGNWSNSLQYGPGRITATTYYVSGYKSVAEDAVGVGATTCADALYDPKFCFTKGFINVDLVGSYEVNDNISVYFNILNLFDAKAPFNPANYAGNNYNPTWTQSGAVGRYFRLGANFKF